MTHRTFRPLITLLVPLLSTVSACDEEIEDVQEQAYEAVDTLDRRIDLRNVPGRQIQAWDAMFALDVDRAQTLLADLITQDCTITFKFPGGEFDSPPGIDGWVAVVTGSAEAGGWVAAGPGLPRSIHNAGSLNVLEESSTAAKLRTYVRASHYRDDTGVDTSEAILEYDVVYDQEAELWKIDHLDLYPLSLREEGGLVLPPVTDE